MKLIISILTRRQRCMRTLYKPYTICIILHFDALVCNALSSLMSYYRLCIIYVYNAHTLYMYMREARELYYIIRGLKLMKHALAILKIKCVIYNVYNVKCVRIYLTPNIC